MLSGTIDKYCWITARQLPPFFPQHRHRIVWSKVEEVAKAVEIEHPAVRACMEFLRITNGTEIHHQGDLPARSGMGSSSAFTVGLLLALKVLSGSAYPTAEQLALDAIHVEQEILRERVGAQDQAAAAYGGFNHYRFTPDGRVETRRGVVARETLEALQKRLTLCYLGPRAPGVTASDVAKTHTPTPYQLRALSAMVEEALSLLSRGSLDEVGQLLHEGWQLKIAMRGNDPRADKAYEVAHNQGALGGKVLGAGGGGFLLLFWPESRSQEWREALPRDGFEVPFRFVTEGAQVVHVS